ncbi:MAG TPA: PKD domain-containing protein [Mycobacteriales bacterium]|nr:PKD domain-containing protein [Mycobacteriales bacterium]
MVDVDAALAAVRQVLEERLPRPAFTVQPARRAVVQLPVIVAAVQHPDAGFDVTVPVPGRLAATASYAWNFGEGEGAGASGPGRPYDGTSPTRHPGHYVSHTYRRAGAATVTLTVTWTATFTLDDGTQFPLAPLRFSTDRRVAVHATRTELVSPS